jgi:hypothetical protein
MHARAHITPTSMLVALALALAATAPAQAARAPRAVIVTGPGDFVPSHRVTFTFRADAARVRYSFRIDGGAWSRFSGRTSVTFRRLRVGRHVFVVRARVPRGPIGRIARSRFVVDVTPPQTRFTGPNRGAVVLRTTASFRFRSSERRSTYECRIDGGRFGPCTSPAVFADMRIGRHVFRVRAVDRAGNRDRTPALRRFIVAAGAPAGSLFSDDFETGALARWAVSKGGGGTVAVLRAPVRTGRFAVRLAEGGAAGSFAFARASLAATVPDAVIAADVRVDARGPAAGSVPLLRVFAGTGARIVNLYRRNDNGQIWLQYGGAYVKTRAVLPLGTWVRVSVRIAARGAGKGIVLVRRDGVVVYKTLAATLAGGLRTVQIGNEAPAQAGVADVDNVVVTNAAADGTPPQTRITSAAAGGTAGTARIAFRSSEAFSSFQCSLDGAAFSACASPRVLTGLAGGVHVFRVRAVDAAGNVDVTPAAVSFRSTAAARPAILIADNQNRRILITDYNGAVLWKFDNPTGETSAYSGPLGVRWMANGHILATFGTGKVGEIDPATKTFLWKTAGYNGDFFQSPYDAELLPDGNLAVATAQNEGGRIAVYNRATGAVVWKYLIHYPHYVEFVPAGRGVNTTKPTLLMSGFSPLTELVYDPGQPDDKTVVWRWSAGSNTHRAILDADGHSLVASDWDNLVKLARPLENVVTWSRPQGNVGHGEVRGVAISQSGPGYLFGYRIWNGASQIRFTDANGIVTRAFSSLGDGTRLNLVWGIRTFLYPH